MIQRGVWCDRHGLFRARFLFSDTERRPSSGGVKQKTCGLEKKGVRVSLPGIGCSLVQPFKLVAHKLQQSKSGTPNATDRKRAERCRAANHGWGQAFPVGLRLLLDLIPLQEASKQCEGSGLRACALVGASQSASKVNLRGPLPPCLFFLLFSLAPSTPPSSPARHMASPLPGWVANRARTEDFVVGDRHHKAPKAWTYALLGWRAVVGCFGGFGSLRLASLVAVGVCCQGTQRRLLYPGRALSRSLLCRTAVDTHWEAYCARRAWSTKRGRDAQPWLQHITPLHLAAPYACPPPPCSFPF